MNGLYHFVRFTITLDFYCIRWLATANKLPSKANKSFIYADMRIITSGLPCILLLTWVHLFTYGENFESGDIQDTDEASALPLSPVQRLVDSLYEPFEHPLIDSFAYGFHSELHLLFSLGLGDIVTSDLDTRSKEGFGKVGHIYPKQSGNLLCHWNSQNEQTEGR